MSAKDSLYSFWTKYSERGTCIFNSNYCVGRYTLKNKCFIVPFTMEWFLSKA